MLVSDYILYLSIKVQANVLKILSKLLLGMSLLLSSNAMAQSSSEYYEEALIAFAENDFEAAYIQLKNSLQKNEDNLPSKILMGKVLMISGYLDEAETVLEESIASGADPSLVVDTLGKVWLFTGKNEKIIDSSFDNLTSESATDWQIIVATANLNLQNVKGARAGYLKALENDPTNIRALNALSSLEMREKNFATAKALLDKSIALEPSNIQTLRLQGDWLIRQKRIQEAIQIYQQSYEIDNDDPLIKRSLVTAYLQNQDVEAARALLDKILEQTPGDPTGLLLKAWLLAKNQLSDDAARELENLSAQLSGLTGEKLQEDPSLIYISGLSAFALQNYLQAKSHFIQYLNFEPNNIEAVALLAQTHVKLAEPKLALEAMQRHERKLMEKIDTALLMAELYLSTGKSFKALEIVSRLKEQHAGNPNLELLEIKTLVSRGKYEEAMKQLDTSPHGKRNVRFILARSQIYMDMGRVDDADKIADQLLELSPDNIDFLNLKAAIQLRVRNFDNAEVYLDQALAINPDHFSARYNKANLLSSRGEHEQALQIVEQLNEIRPDTINVMTLLARNQYNANIIQPAIQNLERVLDKDIDNLTALELLATIYAQQDEPERAIRQLNIAIKTDPKEPRYQMQRAELYLSLKQFERVKRELRKIGNLVKDSPVGLVALSKIYFKSNDMEGTRTSISAAYDLMPNSLYLAIEYIRTHLATKDNAQSREMLNKWLKEMPDEAQLLVLSGDLFLADNDQQAAANAYFEALNVANNYRVPLIKLYQLSAGGIRVADFENVLISMVEKTPDDHFQRNLLADFYVNQGQFDKALPYYEALLNVESLSNKAFVLNNMANIYIDKDLNKAEQYISLALQENVEAAALYDTQGWIMSLKGQHEQALTILRKAFAMNSDDPSNQFHLGYTLHKLNRDKEAKSLLNSAISAQQPFNEKEDAMALLESL